MVLTPEVCKFIDIVPKAELHVHLEGTLEPETLLACAARNNLPQPYPTVEAIREAYNFNDLQSFLDIYYRGCDVLRTAEDFYDLAWAYFSKAAGDNVKLVELFFDPQTHTARGVGFSVFLPGILRAAAAAEAKWGLRVRLIMCFLRHLSEESALATLEEAKPYVKDLLGVGLDSSEMNNRPAKFERVMKAAKELGLHVVAHAGEEGDASYIWEALQLIGAERIDHGVRCIEDAALVQKLAAAPTTSLTVCPFSNRRLQVFRSDEHAREVLGQLLRPETGLRITLNSDDPAYFGGYVNANIKWVAGLLDLGVEQVAQLAKNSFLASFLSEAGQRALCDSVDQALRPVTAAA